MPMLFNHFNIITKKRRNNRYAATIDCSSNPSNPQYGTPLGISVPRVFKTRKDAKTAANIVLDRMGISPIIKRTYTNL